MRILKKNFNYIKELRSNINSIFIEIKEKINALDKIYVELINTHKNMDYTFGIDSFYFQNKLIEIDYENIKAIFNTINNRIYGEYYKLYKMIHTYIITELKDSVLIEKMNQKKTYPIYKDLEPLKTYDFALIIDIQKNIIETIEYLFIYSTNKETDLKNVYTTSEIGINIENLINFQMYSNSLLNERINMFCKHLEVFHKHHNKYFSRLLIKSKMMIGIVNEDIHLKKGNKSISSVRGPTIRHATVKIKPEEEAFAETAGDLVMVTDGTKTPSSIDEDEENNIKKIINFENADENLQLELNTIIANIPQNNIVL